MLSALISPALGCCFALRELKTWNLARTAHLCWYYPLLELSLTHPTDCNESSELDLSKLRLIHHLPDDCTQCCRLPVISETVDPFFDLDPFFLRCWGYFITLAWAHTQCLYYKFIPRKLCFSVCLSLLLVSLLKSLCRDFLKSGLNGEPRAYDSERPAFLSQHGLLKSVGQACISARVQQSNFSELAVSKEVNKHTNRNRLKAKPCSYKEKVVNLTMGLSTPQYMQLHLQTKTALRLSHWCIIKHCVWNRLWLNHTLRACSMWSAETHY